MISDRKKGHVLITTVVIVLVSLSSVPFALGELFSRELYFSVEMDTGFDTGARATVGGTSLEIINDIFATTRFRRQLPVLFDQRNLFTRFPCELVAYESSEHLDRVGILLTFDSETAPMDVRNRPGYHLDRVLDAVMQEASQMHNLNLEILTSGQRDKPPGVFDILITAFKGKWRAPIGVAAVAFLMLWILQRKKRDYPIREMITATFVPALVTTLAISLYFFRQAGWFNPTYVVNRYAAWRHIAIEQQFSFTQSGIPITDEYLWSEYPTTSEFFTRAGVSNPQFVEKVSFELDLTDNTGLFRMVGKKEPWLSLPQEKWELYWSQNPSPRQVTRWLRTSGSLEVKESEFQNAYEILRLYAEEEGYFLKQIDAATVKDNYPHIPKRPIGTIVISIIAAMLSVVLHWFFHWKIKQHSRA